MIPVSDLQVRGIYEIQSRNLHVGAYDGRGGFMGIRQKFGDRYLFTEYHYDDPYHGTVTPLQLLGDVPEDIELRSTNPTACTEHKRLAEFRPDDPNQRVPGKWYHVDDGTLLGSGDTPFGSLYTPLFDLLETYEKSLA